MREPNAIDFWRGIALVTIYIDHVPGNLYSHYTFGNFALSDAAELFVFLAGWALALATGSPSRPDPPARVIFRLASRAIEVYRAQLVITALALGMLAAAALRLGEGLFLEWHNAGPVFFDPVPATLGWVLLTHQLGYFNILPLYVALLAMAPVFVLAARRSPALAFGLSLALYAVAISFRLNLPTWPVPGRWFFDPLTWQLLLVTGFIACDLARTHPAFWPTLRRLRAPAVLIVLVGAAVTLADYRPDPLRVPEPRFLFLFDKMFLSPARLVNFFAILTAFLGVYDLLARRAGVLTAQFSALGRNSLAVFSVGSIAALVGQIVRFVFGGGVFLDTVIVISGIGILVFTAWFVEWRARTPRLSQPLSS